MSNVKSCIFKFKDGSSNASIGMSIVVKSYDSRSGPREYKIIALGSKYLHLDNGTKFEISTGREAVRFGVSDMVFSCYEAYEIYRKKESLICEILQSWRGSEFSDNFTYEEIKKLHRKITKKDIIL